MNLRWTFQYSILTYDSVKRVFSLGDKIPIRTRSDYIRRRRGLFAMLRETTEDGYIILASRKHPIRPQRRSGGRPLTFSQKTRSRCNETMKLVIGELFRRCRNPKENTIPNGRYSSGATIKYRLSGSPHFTRDTFSRGARNWLCVSPRTWRSIAQNGI